MDSRTKYVRIGLVVAIGIATAVFGAGMLYLLRTYAVMAGSCILSAVLLSICGRCLCRTS